MLIFLLWRPSVDHPERSDPERVAQTLSRLFAPLFESPPEFQTRTTRGGHLAWFEMPVENWNAPSTETNGKCFAVAPDYPVNVRDALGVRTVRQGEVLLELATALEHDPAGPLRRLAPPASLIWSDGAEHITLQTDGLGQAQLFESDHRGVVAVTNRLTALRALDFPIEPEAREWATRFTLGWFPGDSTGFRGVRFVPPGTRIALRREGVTRRSVDVLSDWLHPRPMKPRECLELAADSMCRLLSEAMKSWEEPSVGLSGGWDSRGVVALLRHLGSEMSLRVRGSPERYDVMIAAELARIAGLKLRIKNFGGFPPETADGCRRAIRLALLFQSGNLPTKKHKTFLRRKPHLRPGVVNVMGQHAGLGKADFVVKIRAWELEPSQYESRLLDVLNKDFSRYLREDLREPVRESIREAYRAADAYRLNGLARLHFFFLHEYTRRWGSSATSAQTGLVVAPYLNPDFIRAAYAYPQAEIRHRPFHRHIHTTYAPDWANVPFEDEATEEGLRRAGIKPVQLSKSRRAFHETTRWKRPRSYTKYSNHGYWKELGRPLIEEALKERGFWTELLHPAIAELPWTRDDFRFVSDPLAIAHIVPEAMGRPR